MATFDYSFQMPDFRYGLAGNQAGTYGQNTNGGAGGNASVLRHTTPTQSPAIQTTLDKTRDVLGGFGGKFREYLLGNQQNITVDNLKDVDIDGLKTQMTALKTAQEAQKMGINPDGSAVNTGLLGRAQNFAGSNLAKGLGSALTGAAQLGLGYKSFKEGQKMNKELIKDMRTNRASLAEDRARAARDRETFSRMMNTL